MTLTEYTDWIRTAERFTRRAGEAEDLLQDALLIAVEKGRSDFTLEENRRWFTGVLRNRAAMIARTEARRRGREAAVAPPSEETTGGSTPEQVLPHLPPAARKVAVLALHGMNRKEIIQALDITPTAFRRRLTTIRKTIGKLPAELRAEAIALAYHRDARAVADVDFGLVRRALLHYLRSEGNDGSVGAHDPDGHLLVFRRR